MRCWRGLQQAFERERRFVDDASHELRTPLGIPQDRIGVGVASIATKEELEAALASAAEESERLNRLAEDLLVLARSDRGGLPLKRMKIDLTDSRPKDRREFHRPGMRQ